MPVAVVTGGASGLGRALGERCAATMLATPEDAAIGVIDAILADERYIVTHGDLTRALTARSTELARAAESARDR